MLGFHLSSVFNDLSKIGLVRSKRHFSKAYLGHGVNYLRDVEQRGRDEFRVPTLTVERLCTRLRALIPFLSGESAAEIERVVARIDQQTGVADWLGYRFRKTAGRLDQHESQL